MADLRRQELGLCADRRVAIDTVKENVNVSTVFLGLDHGWDSIKALLFETLVFGGVMDGEMDRYTTWEEAEAGHKAMVQQVRQAEGAAL